MVWVLNNALFLSPSANSISAGQLLCGGLFSADSLSNWCAAVALAHALQDNLTQKEQLLRVQLATSLGKPPVSLLQQCTNILSQVGQYREREECANRLCYLWLAQASSNSTIVNHSEEISVTLLWFCRVIRSSGGWVEYLCVWVFGWHLSVILASL